MTLDASVPTIAGGFVGAGFETKLTRSISLKGEYRITDFGSGLVTLPNVGGTDINQFVTARISPTLQIVKASGNYRFWGNANVFAARVPDEGESQMSPPTPARRPWTADEQRKLDDLLKVGKTVVEIALLLQRTPTSIYAQLQRREIKKASRRLEFGLKDTKPLIIWPRF
jgi:hypothetical protein